MRVKRRTSLPGPKSGRALRVFHDTHTLHNGRTGVRVLSSPTEEKSSSRRVFPNPPRVGKHVGSSATLPVIKVAGPQRCDTSELSITSLHGFTLYRGRFRRCSQLKIALTSQSGDEHCSQKKPAYRSRGGATQRVHGTYCQPSTLNSLSGFLWGRFIRHASRGKASSMTAFSFRRRIAHLRALFRMINGWLLDRRRREESGS